MKKLNILLLADIHYVGTANHICNLKDRKTKLALELIQRVIQSVDMDKIDVIFLMGDLVDNGDAPGAEDDMKLINSEIKKTEKPVIVVPGNHDHCAQMVFEIFDDYEGLHEIEGYQIVTFADEYCKNDVAVRSIEKMEKAFSGVDSGRPVITLQHNPIYPYIDSPYPYNLRNANEVMEYYAQKGVTLSVSGHAHWGIEPTVRDNVGYLTCPALCEQPFKYTIITMDDRTYDVKVKSLKPEGINPSDLHIHTGYAYCSIGMEPSQSIDRAKELGLKRIAFTEHAGQLYVSRDDYRSSRFINEPDIMQKNKNTQLNRMKSYRGEMEKYRSASVLVGLEVDLDCNGNFTLLEEDRYGWDILLGAVHYLPERYEIGSKEGFMWANEALLRQGVDVLAHPFRYFTRNKLPVPTELYEPLAELLAYYNTAVELNYHTYQNDPVFFEMCIERGVLISLGSDAHLTYQVGHLDRHLEFLKQICPLEKLPDILY